MKELLEVIVKGIVDQKDDVIIIETVKDENTIEYLISVDKNEIGKIIGKQGRIIKSIRVIAKSMSVKANKKYFVEIVEQPEV